MRDLGFPVLSEHIAAEDPIATFAGKIKKEVKQLTAEDIEKQDIEWLNNANEAKEIVRKFLI